jgi:mono/diheme cytochrome c family protein
LVTIRIPLRMHRVRQAVIGHLPSASLLLGWTALTLLTAGPRREVLAAQTESSAQTEPSTQTQPPSPIPSAEASLPNGPGKEIVLRACVKCHSLKVTTSKRATEDEWATSVNTMVNRGAVLSDDEVDEVIDYLSKNFKPVESDQKQPDASPQK